MDLTILIAGLALAIVAVGSLAVSNREKDRTIERLVLMGKARSAREYGFARAIEKVRGKDVSIGAPLSPRENGPVPTEMLSAEFTREP